MKNKKSVLMPLFHNYECSNGDGTGIAGNAGHCCLGGYLKNKTRKFILMQNSEQNVQPTSVAPDGSNAFVGGSTGNSKRFVKTTAEEVGEEPDIEGMTPTIWWLDTMRPIKEKPFFIAVETYADKDPNDFVKHSDMRILFTDQAEYYFVCKDCYSIYRHLQWSGSTRSYAGWREVAEKKLHKHEETKGWCQFCDPIFGNGGWHL